MGRYGREMQRQRERRGKRKRGMREQKTTGKKGYRKGSGERERDSASAPVITRGPLPSMHHCVLFKSSHGMLAGSKMTPYPTLQPALSLTVPLIRRPQG